MSWMQKLAATYDVFHKEAGIMPQEGKAPLCPPYHTTQQAQITCLLDMQGRYLPGRSRAIAQKAESVTLIPVTEASASRTSAPEPHPLHDKLQYLCTAYTRCGGKEKALAYRQHMELLDAWCNAPHCPARVRAVRDYLQKDALIDDLIADRILGVDGAGRMPDKWDDKCGAAPAIYQASVSPLDAFVRFNVSDVAHHIDLWDDRAVWDSWMRFEGERAAQSGLCYVSGVQGPLAALHPRKLRHAGDGAKLISANDSNGFTYRGRFTQAGQAYGVGKELSEKAHSALRWLISRQAYRFGGQVILAWMLDEAQLPAGLVDCDSETLVGQLEQDDDMPRPPQDGSDFARRLRNAITWRLERLGDADEAMIMGLEAATPGRLCVFYYSELPAKQLIRHVERWHTSCSWPQSYKTRPCGVDEKGKPRYVRVPFVGAPSTKDLIEAAYGERADEKLKAGARKRLLPCIVEGAPLPRDIMLAAARRASNPLAMEAWTAAKVLGIACALVRKYYNERGARRTQEEEWTLALQTDECDRNYLFGRMLAYARQIEETAQWRSGAQARQTNAERLQLAFCQHPARTWKILEGKLNPYFPQLTSRQAGEGEGRRSGVHPLERQLREVISRISPQEFTDASLEPIYLLGYSAQMNEFWSRKKSADTDEEIEAEGTIA